MSKTKPLIEREFNGINPGERCVFLATSGQSTDLKTGVFLGVRERGESYWTRENGYQTRIVDVPVVRAFGRTWRDKYPAEAFRYSYITTLINKRVYPINIGNEQLKQLELDNRVWGRHEKNYSPV